VCVESRERWVGNGEEWWCLGGWGMYGDGERDDMMAWTNERKPREEKTHIKPRICM